jgi:TolB-like protein
MNGSRPTPPPSDRLDSWKEISGYLRRGVRTVQRWEKERGLPVHRLNAEAAQAVFAYRSELDEWWRSEASRGVSSKRRTATRIALAAALALLVLAGAVTARRSARQVPATRDRPDATLGLLPFQTERADAEGVRLTGELERALAKSLSSSPRIAIVDTERFYDTSADKAAVEEVGSSPSLRGNAVRAGVDGLLLGSVTRLDERLRVNVRVVDPASGRVRAMVTASDADMGVAELAEEIARRVEARLLVMSHRHSRIASGGTCLPAPAGAVSWWPGEGSGEDLFGASELVPQGQASFAPAAVGQGLRMNAAGDAFHARDSPRWHLQRFSVHAWVKATEATGSGIDGIGGIVAVKVLTDLPHVHPYVSWALAYQPNDGCFSAIVEPAMVSGTPADYLQSPDGFVAGEFHHVAMTFDGERLKLYVNGVLQAQRLAPGRIDYSDKRLGVGGHAFRGYPYDRTLIGVVDELEIVDRVLSPSELAAIYETGNAGQCDPR